MSFTVQEVTEAFAFLDELRESGVTNMFGSGQYVQDDLGYTKREAFSLVADWMKTYDGDSSAQARAESLFQEGAV